MKRTDLAWAAGIVDGEGSLYVGRSRGYFQPAFVVTMTHEKTMLRIARMFKTRLYTYVPRKPPTAKRYWSARLWCQEAAVVLRILTPYLVTKKEQARLLIRLAQIQTKSRRGYVHNAKRQEEIYRKVTALNA